MGHIKSYRGNGGRGSHHVVSRLEFPGSSSRGLHTQLRRDHIGKPLHSSTKLLTGHATNPLHGAFAPGSAFKRWLSYKRPEFKPLLETLESDREKQGVQRNDAYAVYKALIASLKASGFKGVFRSDFRPPERIFDPEKGGFDKKGLPLDPAEFSAVGQIIGGNSGISTSTNPWSAAQACQSYFGDLQEKPWDDTYKLIKEQFGGHFPEAMPTAHGYALPWDERHAIDVLDAYRKSASFNPNSVHYDVAMREREVALLKGVPPYLVPFSYRVSSLFSSTPEDALLVDAPIKLNRHFLDFPKGVKPEEQHLRWGEAVLNTLKEVHVLHPKAVTQEQIDLVEKRVEHLRNYLSLD